MNFQTLSRSDTETLRQGVCPNCNAIHFCVGGLYHHETGAFQRVLCIACLREFGVSPSNGGTAVILYFLMSNRRLADTYNIHTGSLPEPSAPEIALPSIYLPS